LLINNELNGMNACHVAYSRPNDLLYLVGDDGSTLLGGVAPGTAGTVPNSQCRLDFGASSTAVTGNDLDLTLKLDFFQTSWAGDQILFTAARDALDNNSGWIPLGVWEVPPATQPSPLPTGVTPSHGSGADQTFVITYDGGASAPTAAQFLINRFLDGVDACYVGWNSTFGMALVNDDGSTSQTVTPQGTGTVENSQCKIVESGTSVVPSGNTLTITFQVEFKAGFVGPRVGFGGVQTGSGNSGWQPIGFWSVP